MSKKLKNIVVYKYTSLKNFKEIISSKELWLTDITKSNDTSELKLIYQIIKDVYEEEFLRDKPKYIDKYFSKEEFNSYFIKNTSRIKIIEQKIHTQYVTCFSEYGDMLSQWRGYGDEGKGISIGFDATMLKGRYYKYGKVVYSLRNQKALIRKDIKKEIKKIRIYVKEHKTIDGYDAEEFMYLYNCMLLKAVFIKNRFFHEEKECRLCYWYNIGIDKIKFKLNKNIIKEIIIGPKCKITKDEIENLIKISGFKNAIVRYSDGKDIYVDSETHNENAKNNQRGIRYYG